MDIFDKVAVAAIVGSLGLIVYGVRHINDYGRQMATIALSVIHFILFMLVQDKLPLSWEKAAVLVYLGAGTLFYFALYLRIERLAKKVKS